MNEFNIVGSANGIGANGLVGEHLIGTYFIPTVAMNYLQRHAFPIIIAFGVA